MSEQETPPAEVPEETEGEEVEAVSVPPSEWPKLKVSLLEIIGVAQTQHGMRRTVPDYTRYRKFAKDKLRRLRKSCNFLHAGRKGRYKARKMKAGAVKTPSHLLIVAFQAERAWAYAMQLKREQELVGEQSTRPAWHSLQRLRKAVAHGQHLLALAEVRADEGTVLEARAYACWLQGVLSNEQARWADAVLQLHTAYKLFSALQGVGGELRRATLRLRVESTEPLLTYARYRLGSDGAAVGGDAGDDELQLYLENQRKAEAQNADSLSWRGIDIQLRSARVKSDLVAYRFALFETEKHPNDVSALPTRVAAFDPLLTALGELSQSTNAHLRAYVSEQRQKHIMRRFELMIEMAQAVLRGALPPARAASTLGDTVKSLDVVALYDQLLRSAIEKRMLIDRLAGAFPDASDSYAASFLVEKRLSAGGEHLYNAGRHHAIAYHYQHQSKWNEALALMLRASELADQALELFMQESDPNVDAWVTKTRKTINTLKGERAVLQAKAYEASLPASDGAAANISASTFLMDRLDTVLPPDHPAATRLAALPPTPQPVPVKPVAFDVAGSYVRYPSLENRTKSKGFFSSLWG